MADVPDWPDTDTPPQEHLDVGQTYLREVPSADGVGLETVKVTVTAIEDGEEGETVVRTSRGNSA